MDLRREIEEQLKKYPRQKYALESMEKEMARYRADLPRLSPILADGIPHPGTTEASYVARIVKLDALERCYKLTMEDVKHLEDAISQLTLEEKKFIYAYYFRDPRPAGIDIAEELHMNRRTLYRMRDKILKKICELRYGRCEA